MGTKKTNIDWKPEYSRWRHGGWYVSNVRYPSGACGCVSNNYPDKKWRIACDDRRVGTSLGEEGDFTFATRDAAARAEKELADAKAKALAMDVAGIFADDACLPQTVYCSDDLPGWWHTNPFAPLLAEAELYVTVLPARYFQ